MIGRIRQFLARRRFIVQEGKKGNYIETTQISFDNQLGSYNKILQGSIVSNNVIGSYNHIANNCILTKARIGNYCSIAPYVCLGLGEHALDAVSNNSFFYANAYEELTAKECIIGHDVWIGVKATVRRGVTVGNGAVIGAHTFVNADVPPFAIVVGTPGKIIGYKFDEAKRAEIEASAWWDLDKEKAAAKIAEIHVEPGKFPKP